MKPWSAFLENHQDFNFRRRWLPGGGPPYFKNSKSIAFFFRRRQLPGGTQADTQTHRIGLGADLVLKKYIIIS